MHITTHIRTHFASASTAEVETTRSTETMSSTAATGTDAPATSEETTLSVEPTSEGGHLFSIIIMF